MFFKFQSTVHATGLNFDFTVLWESALTVSIQYLAIYCMIGSYMHTKYFGKVEKVLVLLIGFSCKKDDVTFL